MFEFEKNSKCVITESLKQRFCKDMNFTIKIFEEPYFSNFLTLYDKQYDSIAKYKLFVELVNFYGSEQDYFAAYNTLKDEVITYLNENTEMKYFSQEEDMNKYEVLNKGYPKNDIFKETFDGNYFVSIDMKKGNFTALHHFNSKIMDDKHTYEDFMSMFTDKEYFKMSKYIRQVVFGNVNPKRQVTYERYLMDTVLTEIFKQNILDRTTEADRIVFFSTDEIVIKIPNNFFENGNMTPMFVSFAEKILNVVSWAESNNIFLRAEFFELRKIPGTSGFVKKFKYNKEGFDFKCLDFLTMPFVLRAYNGEQPTEEDCIFIYEGKKVKLLENIDIVVV